MDDVKTLIQETQSQIKELEEKMNYTEAEGHRFYLDCLTLSYLEQKLRVLYQIIKEELS